jgi:hypothetical protein
MNTHRSLPHLDPSALQSLLNRDAQRAGWPLRVEVTQACGSIEVGLLGRAGNLWLSFDPTETKGCVRAALRSALSRHRSSFPRHGRRYKSKSRE